jgi:tartrate dehydrogenase/decarboxylase/D-malate dehydrogenase
VTEKTVWRIAVIPGDGIGTEVVREGQRVLDALAEDSGGRFAFEWESFPWGSEYYLENGRMMAEDALETLEVPDHVSLWGLRIAICQGFDP